MGEGRQGERREPELSRARFSGAGLALGPSFRRTLRLAGCIRSMRHLADFVAAGRRIGLRVDWELPRIQRFACLCGIGGFGLLHDGLGLRWGHCVQHGMGDLCAVAHAVRSVGNAVTLRNCGAGNAGPGRGHAEPLIEDGEINRDCDMRLQPERAGEVNRIEPAKRVDFCHISGAAQYLRNQLDTHQRLPVKSKLLQALPVPAFTNDAASFQSGERSAGLGEHAIAGEHMQGRYSLAGLTKRLVNEPGREMEARRAELLQRRL